MLDAATMEMSLHKPDIMAIGIPCKRSYHYTKPLGQGI